MTSSTSSSPTYDSDRESNFTPSPNVIRKNSRFQLFPSSSSSDRSKSQTQSKSPTHVLRHSGSSVPHSLSNIVDISSSPLRKSSSSGSLSARIITREPTPTASTASTPRTLTSSPRRFNIPFPRKKSSEHSYFDAVSVILPGSNLADIDRIHYSIDELKMILNSSAISPREDQGVREADLRKAIGQLEATLITSWDDYIAKLKALSLHAGLFRPFDPPTEVLTDVHGEKVEITLLEKIDKLSQTSDIYVVKDASERECILLVGKEGEGLDKCSPEWDRAQIESLIWRGKISKRFEDDDIFPVHYHTFALTHEISAFPTACYLIEKLDPLTKIAEDDRVLFCEKLIEKIDVLHGKNCVHGDTGLGNVLCRDGTPLLIDLDPFCFVDFTQLEKMSPSEQDAKIKQMKIFGVTTLYTPPKFQDRLVELLNQKNIRGLRTCLQIKDRYGLALFFWEFCREQNLEEIVAQLEKDMDTKIPELPESLFKKILKTTQKSHRLSRKLKAWIEEALTEGFEKFTFPKADSFSSSNYQSSSLSPCSSCSSTSVAKEAPFNVTN